MNSNRTNEEIAQEILRRSQFITEKKLKKKRIIMTSVPTFACFLLIAVTVKNTSPTSVHENTHPSDFSTESQNSTTTSNHADNHQTGNNTVGNISVVKLNENTKAADMGYCMSRAYWGQGLMPEALNAVMDYLFDVVGLNRIAACHDANNPKSGRVMEKAGMKREGILRAAGKNNLGIHDEVWYAMIRNDRKK